MSSSPPGDETLDFSLVQGGPLFRLLLRSHLSGASLEWLYRRILFFSGVTWLPLLFLSAVGPRPAGAIIKIPFLHDIEAQVRFLVALPVLLGAELFVHRRLRSTVQQFIERQLIGLNDLVKFRAAVQTSLRMCDSIALETLLLVLVCTAGLWIWRSQVALGATTTWYAMPGAGRLNLTPAGWWYAFVSIPVFQFILCRWYLRLFIWIWFLWKVSRLELRLNAMHTDRAGGLSFLGEGSIALGPILFAQGAMLAGLIANRVVFVGQKLGDFKWEAFVLVVFLLLLVLGPLTMFTPNLGRARWLGELDYGKLVSEQTTAFHRKWIHSGASNDEELLNHPDFSSLVDLGSSYAEMRNMRLVPFGMDVVIWLAIFTAAPLLPLALTTFSPDELVVRVVHLLF